MFFSQQSHKLIQCCTDENVLRTFDSGHKYYYNVYLALFKLIYNENIVTTQHHKRKLDGHIVRISTLETVLTI